MLTEFYYHLSESVISGIVATKLRINIDSREKFVLKIEFIWTLLILVADLFFVYDLSGWAFLPFDVHKLALIMSVASFIIFLIFAMAVYSNEKYYCEREINWGKSIISLLIGGGVNVALALIDIYNFALIKDKWSIISTVLIYLQFPYLIYYLLVRVLRYDIWKGYYRDGGETNSKWNIANKASKKKVATIFIILEILMLTYICIFGVLPYVQNNGIEKFVENSRNIRKILFGSTTGVVPMLSACLPILTGSKNNKSKNEPKNKG